MRWLLSIVFLFAWNVASAQSGPGLGNLAYDAGEVFQPIGFIESPHGHGNVTMVQGYLMVIYSSDGGGNDRNGGIEIWNVANPRAPVRVATFDDADTHGLREAHGFSLAWYGSRLLLAAQGVLGIQIWDVTNPLAMTQLAYLDMPQITVGDYSGDWWLFWQAPYLYVAGVGSGLYVVDVTVPTAPIVVAQVPTGDLGGVSPAQVFVLGNLAVVMESQGSAIATLDVATPDQPRLLRQVSGRSGYSHLFAGDGKILTSGNIPPRAQFLQVNHAGDVQFIAGTGFYFNSGGYGSYQDGFFHSGFSNQYVKFDVDPPGEIGSGSSGRTDRDEDFATVLGNIVFAGDDHGVGTALIAHQAAPDTTPPVVEWMHPETGAAALPLTSRVGLSFSDHVDASSLSPTTIWLEDSLGNVVETVRSAQLGLVNLTPVDNLALNTTYTIVAEGVRDVSGNASPRFEGTITTGDGSVPFSPTAAVANVDISLGFGTYAIGTFDEGQIVYSDRSYTFTSQYPARYEKQPYLVTANNDKNNFLTNFLSFDLLAPAEVLVLYDTRATSRPNWMNGFTATGETVVNTDATFDAYTRDYQPGRVELGGNGAAGSAGAGSMYSVVIIPEPVPCEIDLSPVETGTVALSAVGPTNGTYEWRVAGQTFTTETPSVFLEPGRHSITLSVMSGVLGATCSGVKISHRPLAPWSRRVSRRLVWVDGDTINVNPDNGTVTRANAATSMWEVDVGGRPESVALKDGVLWVVDSIEGKVVTMNPSDGTIVDTISLPHGSRPYALVFDDDERAYVTLTGTGEVARITNRAVDARVFVARSVRGLTYADGRLYATRFISSAEQGEVVVVDAASMTVDQTIVLPFDPGPDTEATGRGVPNYVAEVNIAPDGSRAYVASKKDNVARGTFRDGRALTFESRVRTIVSLVDLRTQTSTTTDRYDINDRDMIQTTLTSPLGDLLFVASQGVNIIDVFDVATRERVVQFDVGRSPQAMALNAGGNRLAVYNFLSRSVSYFDVDGLLRGTQNAVVELGEVVTVSNEKLAADVLLGKRIFYDASDERMSRDSYISCASCHLDGGEDGQTWDFTQAGEGLRNTITLRGRSGTGHGNVHWTANFDEIQDFENDIRNAFGGSGFLTDADFARTSDPLGEAKAGLSAELDALAAYVQSLDRVPASPHRAEDGSLTIEARRGRIVFGERDCVTCHAGGAFSDSLRHDVGTIRPSSGQGIGVALDGVGFDTPTLRGLWDTAPYFHDGSAESLDVVLDRHGEIPTLSADERADLIQYMLQLDSDSLAPEVPCDSGPNECVEVEQPPTDAGVPPAVDGGTTSTGQDAGAEEKPTPSIEPEGCSCSATRARSGSTLPWLVLLWFAGRRRQMPAS